MCKENDKYLIVSRKRRGVLILTKGNKISSSQLSFVGFGILLKLLLRR